MVDNVTLNPGSAGDTIAADDISGIKHQRVKIEYGADGSATDVSPTTPLPVQEQHSSTSTTTSVSGSASTVQILASTSTRLQAVFFNDSTAVCYLKLGTTASTTDYTVQIDPRGYYELPFPTYTGRIDAIWSAAAGSLRITELTA